MRSRWSASSYFTRNTAPGRLKPVIDREFAFEPPSRTGLAWIMLPGRRILATTR
jgi:hypothetical protein